MAPHNPENTPLMYQSAMGIFRRFELKFPRSLRFRFSHLFISGDRRNIKSDTFNDSSQNLSKAHLLFAIRTLMPLDFVYRFKVTRLVMHVLLLGVYMLLNYISHNVESGNGTLISRRAISLLFAIILRLWIFLKDLRLFSSIEYLILILLNPLEI